MAEPEPGGGLFDADVADVDAETHPRIHSFHSLQRIIRRREIGVFGAMIVNCRLDIILASEFFDAWQQFVRP